MPTPRRHYADNMAADSIPPVSRFEYEYCTSIDWEHDTEFICSPFQEIDETYICRSYKKNPDLTSYTGFSNCFPGRAHVGLDPLQPRDGQTLGKLDVLPPELVHLILHDHLDLMSLERFRAVSRSANIAVLGLRSYQLLTRHAVQLLRAMMDTWAGAYCTLADIRRVLTTQYCQDHPADDSYGIRRGADRGSRGSAEAATPPFGGYVYLLTCKRICARCVSNDLRYSPLKREWAEEMLGMGSLAPWVRGSRGYGYHVSLSELEVEPSKTLSLPFLHLGPVRDGKHGEPVYQQVVDRLPALALALELHGSVQAMDGWAQCARQWSDDAEKLQNYFKQRDQAKAMLKTCSDPKDKKNCQDTLRMLQHAISGIHKRRLSTHAPPEWLPQARVKLPRVKLPSDSLPLPRRAYRHKLLETPYEVDLLAAQRATRAMLKRKRDTPSVENAACDDSNSSNINRKDDDRIVGESQWERAERYGIGRILRNDFFYPDYAAEENELEEDDIRFARAAVMRAPWINMHADPREETRTILEALAAKEEASSEAGEADDDFDEVLLWVEQEMLRVESLVRRPYNPFDKTKRDRIDSSSRLSSWNQDGIQVEYGAYCVACWKDFGNERYSEKPMFSTVTFAHHLAEHGPIVNGRHQKGAVAD